MINDLDKTIARAWYHVDAVYDFTSITRYTFTADLALLW